MDRMTNFEVQKSGVDIVLVIDTSGSMAEGITKVKNLTRNIYKYLSEKLDAINRPVKELRIKVIKFTDFTDGPDAIQESSFFELPTQADEYESYINDIEVRGGGDQPENGLEALYLALKTDWSRNLKKMRHIVMVFTDSPALELCVRKEFPGYPTELCGDKDSAFEKLSLLWETESNSQALTGLKNSARRLGLFVPNDPTGWDRIAGSWKKTVKFPVELDRGGEEIDPEKILAFFVASASDAER